ncbi:NADPH-dependent FMN reductase [Phyllobacterium zundukense]|jgi:NAD(P)H-dependent FMN reductase|uniref:NAD(P)H-dependent oxidoreductase n=1 Tax=Phyllobacterium zundukense TaxID=1867719 RepID=A0ACD4D5E6_9HYPH|nr:NAD(P)H-dependent oxidoreductase [Phyllobacterium zundukense]UXN61077.1 NAD(P)H-dependent oxidoreductase [Phyllobacterium zundukense]
MAKAKIGIIIGSTRIGRFAEFPAKWIAEIAGERDDIEVEILDLLDYPMHFFGEERTSTAQTETAERWKKKLREFDGFVVTVAEYNHGPTAVLKNAIDLGEFIHKPVGFVGYGGVGGARAIEHLRLVFVEMSAASVKTGIHISFPEYLTVVKGEKKLADYEHLNEAANNQLNQLVLWANALKTARAA